MRVCRCQCAVSARDGSGAGERLRRRRDLQCLLSSKVFDEGADEEVVAVLSLLPHQSVK